MLLLTVLQEHLMGTKRDWSGRRGDVGDEMLLGLDIMRRLTAKRSPMEAKSRKSGGVGL